MLLHELVERLVAECDVEELLEVLDISSSDLISAFIDRVEDKAPKLQELISDTSDLSDVAFLQEQEE